MSDLRAGVIGVGYLGNFHAEKYKKIPGVQLIGVVDTNFERTRQVAHRYGVQAYKDYEALLPHIDLVSIVVPSGKHYRVAKDCLNAGIHCLVEKPLTELVSHATELISTARRKNVVLQVGHLERFNPVARKISSLVKLPELVRARRFSQYQSRGTETDVILDLMIHDLDIVLSLAEGDVKSVQATGTRVVTDFIDIANARIVFSNGLVEELQASRVSSETVRDTEIHANGDIYELNYLTHEVNVSCVSNDGEKTKKSIPVFDEDKPRSDALYEELAAFVSSVTNGSLPIVTGEDGKKALELAVEISKRIKLSEGNLTPSITNSD